MRDLAAENSVSGPIEERTEEYLAAASANRAARVDRMMIWLLAAEWLGMIAASSIISPRVWDGVRSGFHPHLWAAILAGPVFILPTIAIALLYPGRQLTRHAIAVAQMLVSALLIDVTGGRLETHFHIFGSLAFLALYRDWRVLITASLVTALDHIFRGIWWPEAIYGLTIVSPWRWVEHAWWVAFEDFVLLFAMKTSVQEERQICKNKAVLYEGANHDVLTGLANRRLLQARFDAGVQQDSGSNRALLFIDLDKFKQANDALGHGVGDRLLIAVAERFTAVAGCSGTLARVGGDEFVILYDQPRGLEGAEDLAHRILQCLREAFVIDSHELLLSASIGISLYPQHGTALPALQEGADTAMYLAKCCGRNQYAVFSTETPAANEASDGTVKDIAGALAREEFYLDFQPLIRSDGQVAGFEAFARWKHPVFGAITPMEFVPIAEKSGMMMKLGDWVLAEACRACETWQCAGQPPTGVAVNVSRVQFERADYPERVFDIVAEAGIDPALLTLELAEGVITRDPESARAHLTRLRRAGIRIALDDFGIGYSSLSYLSELPADSIKLDRTFLNGEMGGSIEAIESIVSLAHRLGLSVVAEGVETGIQRQQLLNASCDQFQGYHFSGPIGAGSVAALIRANSTEYRNARGTESANFNCAPERELSMI